MWKTVLVLVALLSVASATQGIASVQDVLPVIMEIQSSETATEDNVRVLERLLGLIDDLEEDVRKEGSADRTQFVVLEENFLSRQAARNVSRDDLVEKKEHHAATFKERLASRRSQRVLIRTLRESLSELISHGDSAASCPNACNHHGRCVARQCVCEVGWDGEDCGTQVDAETASEQVGSVLGKIEHELEEEGLEIMV